MRILQGSILLGLLAVLAAACGGTVGDGDKYPGSNDPKNVDRAQFEAVRSQLEKTKKEAFAAAARAVDGEARSGRILLVPCELKGEGVGQLQLNGSLLYSDLDAAASAAAIRTAWEDAHLVTEVADNRSLSSSTTVSGVRLALVASEPVPLNDGPPSVLRRIGAGSACMDLGPELYDEMR